MFVCVRAVRLILPDKLVCVRTSPLDTFGHQGCLLMGENDNCHGVYIMVVVKESLSCCI